MYHGQILEAPGKTTITVHSYLVYTVAEAAQLSGREYRFIRVVRHCGCKWKYLQGSVYMMSMSCAQNCQLTHCKYLKCVLMSVNVCLSRL